MDPAQKQKFILVTHEHPDMDAIASVYLWLLANGIDWESDTDRYELKFVKAGHRIEGEDDNTIHLDTGKQHDLRNFDHHQINNRFLSATGLVWQRFFEPDANKAADVLAHVVNHLDNGQKIFLDDQIAKNLFNFTFWLKGKKRKLVNCCNDKEKLFQRLMHSGLDLLDGFFGNYQEAMEMDEKINGSELIDTIFGATLVASVTNDPPAFRSHIRATRNGRNNSLMNCLVAEYPEDANMLFGVTILYDRSCYINQDSGELVNSNVSQKTNNLMHQLRNRLYGVDPHAKIYVHGSGFVLYVNESSVITFEDVINCVKSLEEEPARASDRTTRPAANSWA